ncbi:DUF3302 domain-containing protein [Pseudaeromonas sharmana]|uniref:DUF3302 domain-containing protein n=1 Tax=Pseudaeromonas sharmana TaxID=328412 RepID=A0ABV8CM25_9GAMM
MFLDYFALGVLLVVLLVCFYGVIIIHDIPYDIAVKRNHPHQDAIHIAGWISLFTLHVIWPFLWIWATLYREDRGWGMANQIRQDHGRLEEMEKRLLELESRLTSLPAETQVEPTSGKGE